MKLTESTKPVRQKDISRNWYLFDAKDKILGRFASEISQLLIGKHKVSYISHMDMGDNIVVVNAAQVKVTGRKEEDKVYSRYSGYPGGLRKEKLKDLRERRPQEIIRHAVWGMLPKNKLRDRRIVRLHIFSDENHTFADKFEKTETK